jgi:hypothetical protein
MKPCVRAVVSDPAGYPTVLTLYAADDDEPVASIALGPHLAVQLAAELLRSAGRRFGRLTDEEMSADSIACYGTALKALRNGGAT